MGCIYRSEGADLGTVVVQLFTPVRAGSKLVVQTTYTGSLTAGLARTAAFNYTDPVTGDIQSQVSLNHNATRLLMLMLVLQTCHLTVSRLLSVYLKS